LYDAGKDRADYIFPEGPPIFPTPRIAMSGEETIKPEGGAVRLAGTIEVNTGFVGEASSATSELIAAVTEATWKEALRQLGEPPSTPLPLWTILASRILRAVSEGERDPQRLKRFALDGLNGYDWSGKDR
jgi:hypothetical protein